MILYKVAFSKGLLSRSTTKPKFILAINEVQALLKFAELVDENSLDKKNCVEIEKICQRDEMIPTIEPIREFKD